MGGVTRNEIARLNADGTPDADFDPNAGYVVYSIAVQANGKILVGGGFTTVGGVTRNYIARVTNTDAAFQELKVSFNGSSATWMRGQASPEVGRVAFEHSADGVTWSSLWNGTRITGGWQITGLSLPINQNHYVRARGYAASGSTFESVRLFYLTPTGCTADFDGDGKPDIIWRNPHTGENAIWYMDGATMKSPAWLPPFTDTNWIIVGTADFDGDGKPDIIWRNLITGENAIWYMNGATMKSPSWLPQCTDTNWIVVGPK